MIFLSGLAHPLRFVGYTRPCLRVVSWWSVDIPLMVWGLSFGKLGWSYILPGWPCLVVSSNGDKVSPSPLSQHPVSMLQYSMSQSVICGVILLSYLVSCVNLCMLLLIFSLPHLPEDLSPRTMPQDYLAGRLLAVFSPPGRAAAPISTVLPAAMDP